MKTLFLLTFALLTTAGCVTRKPDVARPKPSPCEKGKRALWTWNTEEIIVGNATHDFIEFCLQNNVGLVFLHFKNNFADSEKLISTCGQNNIKVHALRGSPRMARKENHVKVLDFVEKVAIYNAKVPAEARIKGIHLDIEPYLLKEFSPKTADRVFKEYVDLMYKVQKHISKTEPTLLFGADIPFWLDHRDKQGNHKYELKHRRKKKPVSEHVIDITDYICVMAYRNNLKGKDGVIELSANEIEYASKQKKKVFVGLETGAGEDIPEKTTFAKKGRAKLESAIKITTAILSNKPSFAGMAIHHYESWKNLTP